MRRLLALGVFIACSSLVAAILGYLYFNRTTTGDVDRLISANLAMGSTADEIFAFLDREGIAHGSIERSGDSVGPWEAQHPPDTPVINALVRDTGWFMWTEMDISIRFYLDDNARLFDYEVVEIYTSL
jgi:hypothetical protein